MSAGFYKNDNGVLLYAPEQVSGPDYDLLVYAKDTYTYPVQGWSWFDSEQAARIFFKIVPPAAPGELVNVEEAFRIPDISDRQFFQQAAVLGLITKEEALNAVKVGAIPVTLLAIVNAIPDADAKFAAEMLLSGATVFERTNALTEQVGAAMGWTSAQLDQFFVAASQL